MEESRQKGPGAVGTESAEGNVQGGQREKILEIKDLCMEFPSGRKQTVKALNHVTFDIYKGENFGLVGESGCGKSTLIKAILQKAGACKDTLLLLETGVCQTASGLIVSCISQDTSWLKGSLSAFCTERHLDYTLLCSILRQLDFERAQFCKNMEDYSEGQKKKTLIAASLLTPAHLYIWDEPLNYIDIFSRMQLEELLQ